MKTYKTWEVIKMLTENENLEFKSTGQGFVTLIVGENRFLDGKCGSHRGINGNIQLNGEWNLVQRPVTFIGAVNSGKRIKNELWEIYDTIPRILKYLSGIPLEITQDYIRGNWFIEEEI